MMNSHGSHLQHELWVATFVAGATKPCLLPPRFCMLATHCSPRERCYLSAAIETICMTRYVKTMNVAENCRCCKQIQKVSTQPAY